MTAAQLSALQRFELITDGLCAAIGVRYPAAAPQRPAPAGPLLILVWTWLRRGAARVALWSRRRETATPPHSRARSRASDAARLARPASGPPRLPRGRGWLIRLTPGAAMYAAQLRDLLADAEMRRLVEASPGIGRVLRPLCRALLIEPEALPPCARPRPPQPHATSPHEAEAPEGMVPPASGGVAPLPACSRQGSRGVTVLGYVAGRRRRPPPLATGRGG